MDRERLKDIHQTDLTEGRVNQDFLDWLRSSGVTWLLMVMIALVVYFVIVRWRDYRVNHQTEAWRELATTALPSGFEDIAERYSDVGAVPQLARLRAASQLLKSVQIGKSLGAQPEDQRPLSDEDRTINLSRADRLYDEVAQADDGSLDRTLLTVTALTGRGAVAECQERYDDARQLYEKAAARAESAFPALAEQSRRRAASLDPSLKLVQFPTASQLTALYDRQKQALDAVPPESLDPWLSDLISPGASTPQAPGAQQPPRPPQPPPTTP